MMTLIKAGDWVSCNGVIGLAKRVSKDGRWADVDFKSHTKRMPSSLLKIETTLAFRYREIEITDLTRLAELQKADH